ncbi:hypothetical protein M0R72_11045 [Candidatus Pacearchaeota archaeon]|jgi:hypothetical protein|nr:hypothetical protein [Candidatus Pacearchaeota archaeon]
MEKIILLAAMLFLVGVAMAEEIEPSEDVVFMDSDGALQTIFSVPAWLEDVTFANPIAIQNGTAIIGGGKCAGS